MYGSKEDFATLQGRSKPEFKRQFLQRGPKNISHLPIHDRRVKLTCKWSKRSHDAWFKDLQKRAGCKSIVRQRIALRGFFAQTCSKTGHENFGWAKKNSRLAIYDEVYACEAVTKYMQNLLDRAIQTAEGVPGAILAPSEEQENQDPLASVIMNAGVNKKKSRKRKLAALLTALLGDSDSE